MKNRGFFKSLQENSCVRNIIIAILVYLNLLAIAHMSQVRGMEQAFGRSIGAFFVAGATAWLLHRYGNIKDKRLKVVSAIGGTILAFTHVYGMYIHHTNNLFTTAGEVVLQFLVVAGIMILTIPLFAQLLLWLDKAYGWWQERRVSAEQEIPRFLFLKYWGIIFACYIPLFLHWWPINFIFDAPYQMQEVLNDSYKIHHPLLHTLLMGWCYKLGDALGSVSLGMSFYTLIQMLVLTASFAYAMTYLYEKGVPKVFRIIVLLIYALFPMNSVFAITATKDVLFAAFFLFFFVLLLKLCFGNESLTPQRMVGLVVSGILMIHFRRNALYALVLAIPFLLWARKGKKQRLVMCGLFLGCMLLSGIINDGVIKAVNATNDDGLQEAMSAPFQQIARVVCYRGAELEQDLYQELLNYWDEEVFAKYDPYLSDPIKNNVNLPLLEDNLLNFWKLWAKIGLKFPGEYIEAFLMNNLRYWYVGDLSYVVGSEVSLYHMLIGTEKEIVKTDLLPIAGYVYDDLFFRLEYKNVPILSYLYQSSVYFWVLIIFALFEIYRKDYGKLFAAMLLFAYMASCFFGPGVILRYVYCIIVSIPVLITLGFERGREPGNVLK